MKELSAQDRALIYSALSYYAYDARAECREAVVKLLCKMGNFRLAKTVKRNQLVNYK